MKVIDWYGRGYLSEAIKPASIRYLASLEGSGLVLTIRFSSILKSSLILPDLRLDGAANTKRITTYL